MKRSPSQELGRDGADKTTAPLASVPAAFAVLATKSLVLSVAAHQKGLTKPMRAVQEVECYRPLKFLDKAEKWVVGHENWDDMERVKKLLDAWFEVVGHARALELFPCSRKMEPNIVAYAVYTGNLDVLALLPVDIVRAKHADKLVNLAAFSGNLLVIQHLLQIDGIDATTTKAIEIAAYHGHLDVVRFFYERLADQRCPQEVIVGAAKRGHLDIVQFLHPRCGGDYDADEYQYAMLRAAATSNDVGVMGYVLDTIGIKDGFGCYFMDVAASHGNPDMVTYLHERNLPCTTHPFDRSSGDGYFAVVKWLMAHRTKGCMATAIDRAAASGQLATVKFLQSKKLSTWTVVTLEHAAENRHWDVAEYLLSEAGKPAGSLDRVVQLAKDDGSGAADDLIAMLKSQRLLR